MLKHKRLPVHKLRTNAKELSLGGAKVFHLPDWHNLSHPERLKVIRQVAMMRARDPRIAKLAVQILKKNGARPRQYKDQAAALLKWVQDPKNVYYVNEPGERLQDPIYTIKEGHGDCDDQILLLTCFFESIGLPWRLVLSGRQGAQKLRHIEGQPLPPGEVAWTHIYCMVGTPPYRPVHWFFCEPTVEGVPLGWDVISGDHSYLPEMSINTPSGSPKLMLPPPAARRTAGKLPPPSQQSPAYQEALGDVYGASGSLVGGAVGATVAQAEQSGTLDWTKIGQAVVTGVLVSVGTSLLLNWINGEGMWEGQGPITKRVRQVVAPTLQASAFVAPIFKE